MKKIPPKLKDQNVQNKTYSFLLPLLGFYVFPPHISFTFICTCTYWSTYLKGKLAYIFFLPFLLVSTNLLECIIPLLLRLLFSYLQNYRNVSFLLYVYLSVNRFKSFGFFCLLSTSWNLCFYLLIWIYYLLCLYFVYLFESTISFVCSLSTYLNLQTLLFIFCLLIWIYNIFFCLVRFIESIISFVYILSTYLNLLSILSIFCLLIWTTFVCFSVCLFWWPTEQVVYTWGVDCQKLFPVFNDLSDLVFEFRNLLRLLQELIDQVLFVESSAFPVVVIVVPSEIKN